MPTSKLQEAMVQSIRWKFPALEFFENKRPEWLENGKGNRLELDIFIPSIDFAIEVQGKQHDMFVEFFHGTFDVFKNQLERDENKKRICAGYGVDLFEVRNEKDIRTALEQISEKVIVKNKIENRMPNNSEKEAMRIFVSHGKKIARKIYKQIKKATNKKRKDRLVEKIEICKAQIERMKSRLRESK